MQALVGRWVARVRPHLLQLPAHAEELRRCSASPILRPPLLLLQLDPHNKRAIQLACDSAILGQQEERREAPIRHPRGTTGAVVGSWAAVR